MYHSPAAPSVRQSCRAHRSIALCSLGAAVQQLFPISPVVPLRTELAPSLTLSLLLLCTDAAIYLIAGSNKYCLCLQAPFLPIPAAMLSMQQRQHSQLPQIRNPQRA